jgi:predicted nuclease with TOPRIM domain
MFLQVETLQTDLKCLRKENETLRFMLDVMNSKCNRLQDKWTSISLKAALTRKQTRELGHLRFQYITRHSES